MFLRHRKPACKCGVA